MDPTKRIIINTFAQYIKAISNIGLALYSTRVVLAALTTSDYGIYSVIAGVVGMLGFITNALVITTQRYLSFYNGQQNIEHVKRLFTNSLFIHLMMGFSFLLIFLVVKDTIIEGFLTIDPERIGAAKEVYDIVVFIFITTILSSPFKAMLIAHENIVYISIVEILESIFKLILAFLLFFFSGDRLVIYAKGLALILSFSLMAFILYSYSQYKECTFNFKKYPIESKCVKQLSGFAGWTTYGMVAGVLRNQGTAVILNHFFGTIVNAAYGIASQVYGAVSFFSSSLLNAMNPQIMKAEGNHSREHMLDLACKESKFSTALMIIISIPMMIEMPRILDFWLEEVPENTVLFCRAILLAFLLDQTTLGLHSAIQAIGKLKTYSLIMFSPKILYLPITMFMLYEKSSIMMVMILYVVIEGLVAIMRIPFSRYMMGISMRRYLSSVIYPIVPLAATTIFSGLIFSRLLHFDNSFIVTVILTGVIGMIVVWNFTLDSNEQAYVKNIVFKGKKRYEKN